MKVFEILLEKKSSRKDDFITLRADYARWKRLVNAPNHMLVKMIALKDPNLKIGLSKREAKNAQRVKTGRSAARAILRMRKKPLQDWTDVDISWMYRHLAFITRTKKLEGPFIKKQDGKLKATRKLQALWSWGHLPNGCGYSKFKKMLKEN